MNMKKTAICAAAMMLLTCVSGCGQKTSSAGTTEDSGANESQVAAELNDAVVGENAFIITLYPDVAPITCE